MRLLVCNCPPNEAESLARSLVEEGLAACVNILPAVRSIYRWEGAIHADTESTLLVKVGEERTDAAVKRLVELHSYEVAEVLVIPVEADRSAPAYVKWVREMTEAP